MTRHDCPGSIGLARMAGARPRVMDEHATKGEQPGHMEGRESGRDFSGRVCNGTRHHK